MKRLRWELSPGAALAGALLLVLLRPEELAALALAVLCHELGHLAAILALRQRLTGFRARLGGFSLDYAGDAGDLGRALIAGAGPGAGLLYALAASRLGVTLERDWLCLSAGLSLLLSLLNLLPAPPLDGDSFAPAWPGRPWDRHGPRAFAGSCPRPRAACCWPPGSRPCSGAAARRCSSPASGCWFPPAPPGRRLSGGAGNRGSPARCTPGSAACIGSGARRGASPPPASPPSAGLPG